MGECLWMLQHTEHALYHFIAAKVEIKTPGALSKEAAQASAGETRAKHSGNFSKNCTRE
jgi:hypothetical protein